MGLGGFPLVSLQEARVDALTNRKLARAGGDPLAERRRARNLPTLEVLDAAGSLRNGGPLVFPTARGKPLKDMALSGLLKELEVGAVPHGFRSSFRDWAAEETDHAREVIEAALAHTVRNPVEAAYARSDLFERRRRLMDDWAAYLVGNRPR